MQKKGISLIVLVITIIVMIILAAAVVTTLTSSGVIDRASHAVNLTNEAQVQDLAALTWSDCYLDKYRGDALVEEVTRRLGEQGVSVEEWQITITDTGIVVKDKNSAWDVVYDGSMTSVDGQLIMPAGTTLDVNSIYRFTVESDEYTGVIETRLINMVNEGLEQYLIAVVKDKNAIIFKNILEVMQMSGKIEGEYTTIMAIQGELEGERVCGLAFQNATCEYTIKKIEKQEITVHGIKVYEVTPTEAGEGSYYLENVNLDKSKKYILEYNSGLYEISYDSKISGNRAAFIGDTLLEMEYENQRALVVTGLPIEGVVTIYDVGVNKNVKIEGENVLVYRNSKWTLVEGNDNGDVPKTVSGQKVEAVSAIMGVINYDGGVELIIEADSFYGEVGAKIIVTENANPIDVFNAVLACDSNIIISLKIDMVVFEDLTIPDGVMSKITELFVSSAVKAKYPDNNKIVAK